jgi:hypothetical protein
MTLIGMSWRRYTVGLYLHSLSFLFGVIVTHEPRHVDEDWEGWAGRWRMSLYLGPFRLGLSSYYRASALTQS